jgi:hypothetical protein
LDTIVNSNVGVVALTRLQLELIITVTTGDILNINLLKQIDLKMVLVVLQGFEPHDWHLEINQSGPILNMSAESKKLLPSRHPEIAKTLAL